jgi:glycerophosphoryl diester phosphodiesterase
MALSELKSLRADYGRPEFTAERIPTLVEAAALIPEDIVLALELKTDQFREHEVCQRLAVELDRIGIRHRSVVLSFSLPRLQAVRAVAPDIPIGWITLSRPWPLAGVQMLGPLWPLLLVNPLYVRLAQRRGQVVCPLDPTPEPRLGLYRRLGCDAVLSNDPAATARALGRQE